MNTYLDATLIENLKRYILNKMDEKYECEVSHKESNKCFFIKSYDEGLSFHLYMESDLIVGDVDLREVSRTLLLFDDSNRSRKNIDSDYNKILNSIKSKEDVKSLLISNDRFLCEALIMIFNCQTDDEKDSESTKIHNNVGFNAVDADFLSSISKGYLKYHRLTSKQIALTRKKMLKYSNQVFNLLFD